MKTLARLAPWTTATDRRHEEPRRFSILDQRALLVALQPYLDAVTQCSNADSAYDALVLVTTEAASGAVTKLRLSLSTNQPLMRRLSNINTDRSLASLTRGGTR